MAPVVLPAPVPRLLVHDRARRQVRLALDVATRDDLTTQDRVTVVADTVRMVSGWHAGDVGSSRRELP